MFYGGKEKRNPDFKLSFYSKVVLFLPFRSLAILDSIHRTMVVARHAHRAVAIPFRAAVFHGDVLQRTYLSALATMNTGLGDMILAVVGGRAVETRVYQVGLEPCQTTYDHF